MTGQSQPADAFCSIRWTIQDLLVALALRLPEHGAVDEFDLLDAALTAEDVGVTSTQLEDLADRISGVLEDISIARGWEVLHDSLDFHLGFAGDRIQAGQHPNSLRP